MGKLIDNPLAPSEMNSIPELSADPASPLAEDVWVLKSGGGGTGAGEPIGLALALTYAGTGGAPTYQLSYRTLESTTIRSVLA